MPELDDKREALEAAAYLARGAAMVQRNHGIPDFDDYTVVDLLNDWAGKEPDLQGVADTLEAMRTEMLWARARAEGRVIEPRRTETAPHGNKLTID